MPKHTNDEEMPVSAESIISKLVRQNQEKEKKEEKIIENIEDWKKAINSLCASPNGQLLIKYMLRDNKLFIVDNSKDHVTMLENRGAKRFYLKMIRPFLTPEVISIVENQK